jgi:hypothetical protein
MVLVHKNPDYGAITTDQYKKAVRHAISCLDDVHQQMASVGEVMATNGAVDATSGFVGGFAGYNSELAVLAAHAVPHAALAVGTLNGVSNGVQGAANGLKIKSGAVTNVVGNCANGDIHDPLTAVGMAGMHIYGSPVRTSNRSDVLPSYVKKVSGVYIPPGMRDANHHEPQQETPSN